MRAMPQIKEVADQFRGQPVAILGMCTDRKDEDARFVVDKLQLNYPTLHGIGIPEKYGVQGDYMPDGFLKQLAFPFRRQK